MKRMASITIAFVLVFSFILAGVSPVQATPGWPNPTVTVLSGDTSFTATPVSPAALAGAIKGSGGYYPSGFVELEGQFAGKALMLSGISSGTQQVCFAFPTYRYGWRGSIYQWFDKKWVKLPTSIDERKEATTLACTTTYGNGVYALLVGYDPKLAPGAGGGLDTTCDEDISQYSASWDWIKHYWVAFEFAGDAPALGTEFNWVMTDQNPADFFSPTSGIGTITLMDGFTTAQTETINTAVFDMNARFSYTMRIYTPECHIIHITGW